MLISVVYGDGRVLLCNADCAAANLLRYVRKQTGNLDCEVVDLSDETGTPRSIRPYQTIVDRLTINELPSVKNTML